MKEMMKRLRKKEKGFTLIELIVVIAIIAILAAVLVPRFTGFNQKAEVGVITQNATVLSKKIALHYAEHGSFPASLTYDSTTKVLSFDNFTQNSVSSAPTYVSTNGSVDYTVTLKDGTTTKDVKIDANGKVTVSP